VFVADVWITEVHSVSTSPAGIVIDLINAPVVGFAQIEVEKNSVGQLSRSCRKRLIAQAHVAADLFGHPAQQGAFFIEPMDGPIDPHDILHVKGVEALLSPRFSKDLEFVKRYLVIPEEFEPAALPFGGSVALLEVMNPFRSSGLYFSMLSKTG
jgi:hypothetical protein